jgi:hypothetical protein
MPSRLIKPERKHRARRIHPVERRPQGADRLRRGCTTLSFPSDNPSGSRDKAAAFLDVLEKSVGDADGAIVPDDLEDALNHISRLAPPLERDMRFQRLQTMVRR